MHFYLHKLGAGQTEHINVLFNAVDISIEEAITLRNHLSHLIESSEYARQNKGSAEQQTDNSGYITALSVFEQWKEEFDTCEGDKQGFYEWLKTRLHSLKAANDT
jgi:hypothetical protein